MGAQFELTEPQWDLIRDLLAREQDELPHEIHYTHSAELRHTLQERLRMVNDLLAKLRPAVIA